MCAIFVKVKQYIYHKYYNILWGVPPSSHSLSGSLRGGQQVEKRL